MKSLNDQYKSSHGSTHETFADLVFCALIVLVLFVLALAIEVSQRVRAELAPTEPVEVVKEVELKTLTKEEIATLSEKLQKQEVEMKELQQRLQQRNIQIAEQSKTVKNKLAAMNGEQRYTGARQPAAINLAYDYRKERFYFIPSKEVNHADRRLSGESALEYAGRKTEELVAIALKARKQRGYSVDETKRIFQAFTKYQQVIPVGDSYRVEKSRVNIYYHTTLCGYIAGDTKISDAIKNLIQLKLLDIEQTERPDGESMYPQCTLSVDLASRNLKLNGLVFSLKEMKDVLLSFDGRGTMIDLEGLNGPAPEWLKEKLLNPTGYISKTPKVPN